MIDTLLHPRSVCLVGASADPRKLAGKTLIRLEQHSFPGDIHLVNPRRSEIAGRICHPSVAAIGAPVDVALISLPAGAVPDAVRECGAAGVKFAVVISSGFGEDSGSGAIVDDLAAAIAETGIRLVGPNCEGIWSTPASMALTFGSAADRPSLLAGPVSLISQSGSIGAATLRALQNARVGCRYFVSSGNEADLTAMDYLEHLVDEGGSDVIALFVEGLRDGHRLPEIAARANAAGIRLLALCSGASELGRAATASHTGRISSAAAVYRDVLAASGVVQVDSLSDFVGAIKVAAGRVLPPSGPGVDSGVGVVALSGGSRALLADACEVRDVPMATFTADTVAALEQVLPKFGYAKNPTDLTGEVASNAELFGSVARAVIDDENTEAVVVQYANAANTQLVEHTDLFGELVQTRNSPIVLSTLGGVSPEVEAHARSLGALCATDPTEAVRQLGWLYQWRRATERKPDAVDTAAYSEDSEPFELGERWVDQMAVLEGVGVPAPAWRVVDGADIGGGGIGGAADLDYPVVLKALPEHVAHKTEAGLVFLGLRDEDELVAALATFAERTAPGTPALVQEMASGQVEMLLSARHDPDFGPLLVIGAGGVTTEWQADVVHIALPASRAAIAEAIDGLKIRELLGPFRGRPASDVDALVDAAHRLGVAYVTRFPHGSEIEINPLLVGAQGNGVVAVDVLYTVPGA